MSDLCTCWCDMIEQRAKIGKQLNRGVNHKLGNEEASRWFQINNRSNNWSNNKCCQKSQLEMDKFGPQKIHDRELGKGEEGVRVRDFVLQVRLKTAPKC